MARKVAEFTVISKRSPWSVEDSSCPIRIRCPDELIGKNSVTPCTTPNTIGCRCFSDIIGRLFVYCNIIYNIV